MTKDIVKYALDNGQSIEVTEQDVRDLLSASGQVAQNVTSQEIKTFLRLCQAQRLNPFTKDAYIVKYGSSPATIITGKEAFTKRAFRHPKFRGMEAGITVIGNDGKLHRREGSMLLDGETLTGGWCRVYIEGYETPIFDEVSLREYSTGKGNWDIKNGKPATMIRKVAITHALREAFPEDLGGLYSAEEMERGQGDDQTTPQEIPAENVSAEDVPESAPAEPQERPIDAYKAALTIAKRDRGIAIKYAMERVNEVIGKNPIDFTGDDIAKAVEIVNGLGMPEEQEAAYEVVDEPTEYQSDEPVDVSLADHDIPF